MFRRRAYISYDLSGKTVSQGTNLSFSLQALIPFKITKDQDDRSNAQNCDHREYNCGYHSCELWVLLTEVNDITDLYRNHIS